MWWKEAPFARLLMPFGGGLVLYEFYPGLPVVIPSCLLGISFFLWWIAGKSPHHLLFKFSFYRAVPIHLAMMNLAYLLAVFYHTPNNPSWYKAGSQASDFVLVRIAEEMQQKPRSLKAVVEIKQCVSAQGNQAVVGKAIVYFKISPKSLALHHGDFILVRNRWTPIRSNSNPGGFDYSAWCKRQQVFESVYLQDKDWQATTIHQDDVFSYFGRLGLWTKKCLSRYIKDTSALGIAEALLIGYRGDITQETWQAYSRTGIVHIIAISGMHMALVYGSIRWLLAFLPFCRRYQKAGIGIALCLMWMFAAITGMPPSVARAAIMLSFVGIGEVLNKEVSGLNNLCASGFLLMCFNPTLLLDVGFQLSFIAVLSLLLFQSAVYQMLTFKLRVADWIWQLTAVTIAAQILTFPICVYYFHQFPLLFLTNLVAIPLTTLLLYLEILLLLVSSVDQLAGPLGLLIEKGILVLNLFVQRVGNLGFAVWSNLQISFLQMGLFYFLIMAIFLWLARKKATYLMGSLGLIFFLLSTFCYDRWKLNRQTFWIIYDSRKQKYMEFIKADKFYSPDHASLSEEAIRYTRDPSHIFFQVSREDKAMVASAESKQVEIIQFGGHTMVRLKGHRFQCLRKLQIDYLVLSDEAAPSAAFISEGFICRQIIIDNSIPIQKARKLASSYASLDIPVHLVHEQGAFIKSLKN